MSILNMSMIRTKLYHSIFFTLLLLDKDSGTSLI